ncbi:lipid IV(A) 3-deoxy-D-manno-octulosonic acid transferase [Thalassomonas haliotis]|uniref:3-deoxy-D-manno-octulosonic acid transferase n=1 Tax=Thalassomonas haliotis TaxID=485448 RepID=A0ABY7VF87_9GAMM|nr:lipid IV(A) 3-deoxy-D-manno-octulosonic acid transferase [Thalassomonas haliotis]WDE11680.1 lipid IV(A) 3-deoxy-D-manno-octulosonic acid transferase [Thalassomonas haliotis]
MLKYHLALLLYRFFLLINLPVIIIVLLIRSTKHKAYRQRLTERLGLLPGGLKSGGIVIHAASVGEVMALKAFIEQVLAAYPELPVTLTTFTPTGSAQVKKLFADRVQHCYLPLDIWPCSTLFLRTLAPKAMVFMETELWPNLLGQSAGKNIPLLLVNGRLSENSMKSYRKLSWLITPALQRFDTILPQSQPHRDNFLALGAKADTCIVSGNLKFDISQTAEISNKQEELSQLMANRGPVWIAASTHEGDEQLILAAYKKITLNTPKLLLVMVPRHPERFEKVHQLCLDAGLSVIKRSSNQPLDDDSQVWLLDTLGELMAAYALSDIVTIGGTFSHIGGHNPLEPALFKKPVIVGSDMSNFAEIHRQFNREQAVIEIPAQGDVSTTLAEQVQHLLDSPQQAQNLGQNGYDIVRQNQGASAFSLEQLSRLLAGNS